MHLYNCLALACALLALPATAASADALRAASPDDAVRREAPDPCANAGTQAAMAECAHQNFLKASAAMSGQLRQLESVLTPGQRTTWRRVQKAWLTYRTQACHFESSQLGTGSARTMVQWQCAARMTRERAVELSRFTACPEGDIACPLVSPPDRKRSIFSKRK